MQQNLPSQESIASLIQYYRTEMQNGSMTPASALSGFNADMTTYLQANNPQGYASGVLQQYEPQLYAPMTINKGGDIMQLNSDGSVTVKSTAINQSNTTAGGTQTSTSYNTPGQNGSYTVKSGDTLSQIAAQNGMTTQQLIALNPQYASNPNLIQPGQSVNLGTSANGQNGAAGTTSGANGAPTTLSGVGGTATTGNGTGALFTPTPTGNPTLDAAQDAQVQYVTGALSSGYKINPALASANIASLLPQFIQETSQQLQPELQQQLQAEMQGVTQALQTNATNYTNEQGTDVQNFQTSLGSLLAGAPPSAATTAEANGLAANTNRTLSSLDTNYANQQGQVLQGAGSAFGTGVFNQLLSGTGQANSALQGYTAGGLGAPNVNPLQVGIAGGNAIFAGSTGAGNPLNYNYDPNIYKYGSIPTSFASSFGNALNQNVGNYIAGANATGATNTGGITSASGLTL